MDSLQFRDAVGGQLQLLGDIADVDSRHHTVQVTFPHERVDSFKTTFGPEAFRDSFAERLPAMCWQHDIRDPIGHAVSAQVLPGHNELIGQFSDLDAVPNARRAFSQIESKDLTDFSFGYTDGPERQHPDPQLRARGVRQIPKARMREFSPVTIGSIPGAVATGIREEGNIVTPTVSEIIELRREKLITQEVAAVMLRDAGVEGATSSLDATQRTFPESAAVDAAMAVQGAAQQAVNATAEAARLAAAGFNPECQVQLVNASNAHMQASSALYGMALAQGSQDLANLALQHSFRGQEALKAAQTIAAAGTDPGVAERLATGASDQAKATAALTANIAGTTYPASPGGSPLQLVQAPPMVMNAPREIDFTSIFTRDDASASVVGAGSDVGDTGSMADSDETPGSHAEMAEESLAMAKTARAAEDHKSARMHATHARMHAKFTRASADLTKPDDANAVERADQAAAQAEDVISERSDHESLWNPDDPVTADLVMATIKRHDPDMAEALARSNLAVAPNDVEILFRDAEGKIIGDEGGTREEGDDEDQVAAETAGLAASVNAALESASEWFGGATVEDLPDEVQQGLALVGAAGEASRALLEALQIRDPEEDLELRGDAADWSTEPWGDIDQSDYSPEQWKSATLIHGDGDGKDAHKLPVKEPGGKYNVHGIAAAATRLDQVDAPDADKKAAAKTIMGLYGKMKKPTPPNVLKVLGHGTREAEEALLTEAEAARDKLERLGARRQRPAA